VVGSCFGVHFCPYFGEGFSHGKSSVVALVFGFVMDPCQTPVVLNHCVKCGFLVCMSFNVLQYNIIILAACFSLLVIFRH